MRKRLFAFFLAALMALGILASCGDSASTTSTAPSPTPSAAVQTPKPDGGEEIEDDEQPAGLTLPLAETLTTIKGWMAGPWGEAGMVDANGSPARQLVEANTNVHVEWEHPMAGQENVSFNLMLTSNLFPDIICAPNIAYYVGGPDKYVEMEVIADLKEYMPEYAPNYLMRRAEDTYFQFMSVTDSGAMPLLRHFKIDPQPSFMGKLVRGDWLEELDIDVPVTFDDWTNMLTAFKDQKSADLVMSITNTGMDVGFLAAFGLTEGFIQENGVVKYAPQLPEFKDYVTQLREWYLAGLIDPDFFARNNAVDSSHITLGRVGAFTVMYTQIDYYDTTTEGNCDIVPVALPVKAAGDTRSVVFGSTIHRIGGATAAVAADSKNIGLALSYLDYFYSDEGSLIANYGIENQSFVYGADGNPKFTELVGNNPDGLSLNNAMANYAIYHSQPFWYNWKRELTDAMSEKAKGAGLVWDANYVEKYTMPEVTPTSDESTTYANIYNSIMTMVREYSVKFITTPGAIENEYDEFLSQMDTMGIADALAVQQAAFTRYNERKID